MRDTKFRLWDHTAKRMAPVCKLDWHWGTLWASIPHAKADGTVPESHALEVIEVHSGVSELMEYTGHHDKDGKEIYEGDITNNGIIRFGQYDDSYIGFYLEDLEWCKRGGKGHHDTHDLFAYTTPFEVLGNIYQNPELVK